MLAKFSDVDVTGKRVLIREDLNVPLDDKGNITEDTRIKRALPTIQHALKAGAKVMVMSHLGRPTEGEFDEQYSLKPVAERLQQLLDHPVRLEKDWLNGVQLKDGDLVLCENVRFNKGEKANDEALSKKMAALCDVFVMDAFATAHRAQASTTGIAEYVGLACAGPLLQAELDGLARAIENPAPPMLAVVGGSKVSSKIDVLQSLLKKVNCLIVGGGIANTLLAAKGYDVADSLYEPEWCDKAKAFFEEAAERHVNVPLPVDVVVSKEFSNEAETRIAAVDDVQPGEKILDIGPKTAELYAEHLMQAGTIVWNGPVGVFELQPFSAGTKRIAEAIASSQAYSIAGGGDTLAAIAKYNIADDVSYISTGGGAFLALLEGDELPAVKALQLPETSSSRG
ncbi:MAG: phosphoglycerate kinase [Coxiellaceae bacterium]|nr:phosphoglycerate kinase [Coxiellaceae bacterium]